MPALALRRMKRLYVLCSRLGPQPGYAEKKKKRKGVAAAVPQLHGLLMLVAVL